MTRTEALKHWIETRRCRHRLRTESTSLPGFQTNFTPGREFEIGLGNFRAFLQDFTGGLASDGEHKIGFSLDPEIPPGAFRLVVSGSGSQVSAQNERGLVDAMHYIAHEMADLGTTDLPPGNTSRTPTLTTHFTEGCFIPAFQYPDALGDFSDEYLALMRHYGGNALKLPTDLAEIWQSEILPELNAPDVGQKLDKIRAHTLRLKDHGFDLFLMIEMKALPVSHPVFLQHPDIAGAVEEIFLEETSGRGDRVLCSSHDQVLAAYAEVIAHIFQAIPELAGAIALVGGEGFHHCFMRPAGVAGKPTNCARCQGQDPHQHVARLVNTLAAAVQSTGPGRRFLAWPYSAFIWSRDDPTDSRWVQDLDGGVEVLANFNTGDIDATTGGGAILYDYNIKQIGPSTRFKAQSHACSTRKIPILAKTETNTTPDTFFLPYLPVHFRWHQHFCAIRESGASGLMGQWKFFGMNGSLPEELLYHAIWNPNRTTNELLHTAARRDFSIRSEAADQVVDAWREMSAAWDDFPYSAMTSGELEAYMRGPWYLGPAHPLVLNEQAGYGLGEKFYRLRGDLVESIPQEELTKLPGKPRYVCNLLFCLPFGVEKFLTLATSCRDRWDQALQHLEMALGAEPVDLAVKELNVCRTISIHLHTLVHVAQFFRLRDGLGRTPITNTQLDQALAEMDAVVRAEIRNAQRALPILEKDPRIGYGFTYGEVYDVEMVREKIQQCEFIADKDLPRIGSMIRFHVWSRYP